ncbi:MAG: D-aminoacyl-tRNA deacylase [Pirellulaceae bacterium]|nr:MAG: D-aminoacyl-tRNA deacylase [Pirellulaceae bacterium]
MRAVVQRVREASVTVGGRIVGQIGHGLVVLLGVASDDTQDDAQFLARKIVELRIFEDEQGKMNRSLLDCQGQMLVVSQFTLLADCRKGRRPSFVAAAPPEQAQALYENFVEAVRSLGIQAATGEFRAMMDVALVNYGPVTILLDSHQLR